MSEAIEKRVLAEVDRRFGDTVEFLRALVRQPSTLGSERGAQELVLNRLRQMGLDAQMWDLDPQVLRNYPGFGRLDISYVSRPNVTALWPAAAPGGKSVILNGHIDVVSPEPTSQWEHDPWGAQVEGDWIYGRGAGDMKAGVAAMLLAVEAVKATGVGLRGDVILESVIEEECSGNGTLACGVRGLKADAAIIPEPEGLTASLSAVGVFWFRVRVQGRGSHALSASSAVNAIEAMLPLIGALRRFEAEKNARKHPAPYQDAPHPMNLNLGILRAGDWPSSVPSECVLEARFACLPGTPVAQAKAELREAILNAARADAWLGEHPPEVEFFGLDCEPSLTDPACPPMQVLAGCHQAVVGQSLAFKPSTATTDERFFNNYWNTPATAYGPAAEGIHAPDERVSISSIANVARVLALFVLRWCRAVLF